jgi:hypothetical protein
VKALKRGRKKQRRKKEKTYIKKEAKASTQMQSPLEAMYR